MTLPVGYSISPINHEHVDGFHGCLDIVSKERRYLAFVEAPPIDQARQFVEGNISAGVPQYVALLATNVPAIALYLRSGFAIEGCKRRARYLDGEYDDLILMAKWLESERRTDTETGS